LVEISDETHIKICRNCHTVYKKLDQKFCGNGCEKKIPFLIDGKINTKITEREVVVKKNESNTVRWICMMCHSEFDASQIKSADFSCPTCNTINQIYPFTEKACAKCKNDMGVNRNLLWDAKACDKCGEKIFLLNHHISVADFKPYNHNPQEESHSVVAEKKKEIFDNSELILEDSAEKAPKNTNLPSITLTILNNNCEFQLFGTSKQFTVEDLIHYAHGYMPESLYEYLLQKYPGNLFEIEFKDEKFFFKTPMPITFTKLNSQFKSTEPFQMWDAEQHNPLPDSQLLAFNGDRIRFRIWVY
jgi:DNA-directed RNA polymerase subunit RPC12/RpoP